MIMYINIDEYIQIEKYKTSYLAEQVSLMRLALVGWVKEWLESSLENNKIANFNVYLLENQATYYHWKHLDTSKAFDVILWIYDMIIGSSKFKFLPPLIIVNYANRKRENRYQDPDLSSIIHIIKRFYSQKLKVAVY